MSRTLSLCLAQINVTVGALEDNTRRIINAIDRARAANTDVIIFPELVLTGYPPEDLLLRPAFIRKAQVCLQEITASTQGIMALIGCRCWNRIACIMPVLLYRMAGS